MDPLFRTQALAHKKDRLHGELLVLPRFSHTLIISLLLIWLALLAAWLFTNSYARKETVTGWLEPRSGVTRVYPESAGTIKQVLVREGEHVAEGQPLLIVNGDRTLVGGEALEATLLEEYRQQQNRLSEQLTRTDKLYRRRADDLQQQVQAAREDLALIDQQIATLNERYQILADRETRYQSLVKKNHISTEEYNRAREQLLSVRSERQALARGQINQKNELKRLQSEDALLPIERANQVDQLRASLGDIARQIAQLHGERAHVIKASRSGVVNNLQVREGQQARLGVSLPLLVIVPEQSTLVAELLVPVRAIGFVSPGQAIDIRYDAFPYQKFGLYSAEVMDVSRSVMLPNELNNVPSAVQEPVYLVKARLGEETVNAYGARVSLKPGMTLTADITLSDRSLVEWFMEPLYSLKGRI